MSHTFLIRTYDFQFHFHLPGDVDRLFPNFLYCVELSLVEADGSENSRVSEVGIWVWTQRDLTGSNQRVCSSRLLLKSIRLAGLVHLNLLVVNFPQQAVKFLLVSPISVQHQRDYRENKQHNAGNPCRNFSRVADALLTTKTTLGLGYRRLTPNPWDGLEQLQTLLNGKVFSFTAFY